MHDLLTGKMLRQRLALRLRPCTDRRRTILGIGLGDRLGFGGLQFFELDLKLLDLPRDLLGRPAELHPPELGDLVLELLISRRILIGMSSAT
jgi:hypothetical protein